MLFQSLFTSLSLLKPCLSLPTPKARDLDFGDLDSSTGYATNKSQGPSICGPQRGVRRWATGPPL